jgi:hypothetical protein
VALCFSFLLRFLFSCRCTGGGLPSTARAADLTAVVAVNLPSFFFLGMSSSLTLKDYLFSTKTNLPVEPIALWFIVTKWMSGIFLTRKNRGSLTPSFALIAASPASTN